MLPLAVFLLISGSPQAVAAPLINPGTNYAVPQLNHLQQNVVPRLDGYWQAPTCYTVRSYRFRRQDGQAPVLAGVTTCTPADTLRQKQVSPGPVKLEPLNFGPDGK